MSYEKKMLVGLMVFPLSVWLCAAEPVTVSPANAKGDYVVLLHGLIRSSTAMKRLEWAFENAGYRVINVNYSSTKHSIEDIAAISLTEVLQEKIQDPKAKVHFVTHSLGGIVLREYLANNHLPNLGRVVMIAPPNQGSELVDKFKNFPFFKFFTGPAGQQLGTGAESVPQRLPPANFELGIIAGDRTLNPFYSWFLPGPDDGKVTVASTHLEGMNDFLVVHSSHTYLPWRKQVVSASVQYVAEGEFRAETQSRLSPTQADLRETKQPLKVYASPRMQAMR